MFNSEPIVIDSDSESGEQQEQQDLNGSEGNTDVKPLIKPAFTFDTDTIEISDSEPASNNPTKRIKCDCNYCCYLCDQQFEMQFSFLDHIKTDHANDK